MMASSTTTLARFGCSRRLARQRPQTLPPAPPTTKTGQTTTEGSKPSGAILGRRSRVCSCGVLGVGGPPDHGRHLFRYVTEAVASSERGLRNG